MLVSGKFRKFMRVDAGYEFFNDVNIVKTLY